MWGVLANKIEEVHIQSSVIVSYMFFSQIIGALKLQIVKRIPYSLSTFYHDVFINYLCSSAFTRN